MAMAFGTGFLLLFVCFAFAFFLFGKFFNDLMVFSLEDYSDSLGTSRRIHDISLHKISYFPTCW